MLREFSLVLAKIDLHFFDQLIKEHLHYSKIILKFLHDLVSNVVVDEKFVLFLGEGFTVDFALLETDVALVGYHALPF